MHHVAPPNPRDRSLLRQHVEMTPPSRPAFGAAQRPDFITVSMPGGYIVQPRIPYLLVDPIPLKPQAVMAYGGGS